MAVIDALRQTVAHEVFDYQTLLTVLSGYAHPRDKITEMLRKQEIVRIKKGLYLFGEPFRRGPYSRELLANLEQRMRQTDLDWDRTAIGGNIQAAA